jgi:hypothetical protein
MPTLRNLGIKLVINDADEHTPAMVYAGPRDSYSASFDCATGEGELMGSRGDVYTLTAAQVAWLESKQDHVEEAFAQARKHWKD